MQMPQNRAPVQTRRLGTMVVLTNLAFALSELGQRRQALEPCQQIIEEGLAQPAHGLPLTEGAYLPWSLLSLEANELSVAREQGLCCTLG